MAAQLEDATKVRINFIYIKKEREREGRREAERKKENNMYINI